MLQAARKLIRNVASVLTEDFRAPECRSAYRDGFGHSTPLVLEHPNRGRVCGAARLVMWRLRETAPLGVALLDADPHGCLAIVSEARGVLLLEIAQSKTSLRSPRPTQLAATTRHLLASAGLDIPVAHLLARPFIDGIEKNPPFLTRKDFTKADPWRAIAERWPPGRLGLSRFEMTATVRCLWGDICDLVSMPCWWEPGPDVTTPQIVRALDGLLGAVARESGTRIRKEDLVGYAAMGFLPEYLRLLRSHRDASTSAWCRHLAGLHADFLADAMAMADNGVEELRTCTVPRHDRGVEILLFPAKRPGRRV